MSRNIEKKHIRVQWPKEMYKSAGDEDRFIIDFFNEKQGGYLVDIGAACPVSGSLSFKLLNNYSWNGILVEPLDIHEKNISACYGDIDTIHHFKGAIHNNLDNVTIYVCNAQPGLSSLKRDHIPKSQAISEQTVKCIKINDLFEKYNAPTNIDFLNLDIERSEDEVIYNIDYDKYNISLMCIEHGIKWKNFLESKGYQVCNTNGYNILHSNCFFKKIIK